MPMQPARRPPSTLASVLAVASLMLAVASCSQITPLGPSGIQFPAPRQLGSPIIVQAMGVQPATAAGGCPAGWIAVSLSPGGGPRPATQAVPVVTNGASAAPASPSPPGSVTCYRPVGTPVTITSAAVSAVGTFVPPPGQANGPDLYGFVVAVPDADVAAVTAVIRQAYDSHSAVGITVAGKLWQAPVVFKPFAGQRLEISFLSRNEARQLYRLLVPSH